MILLGSHLFTKLHFPAKGKLLFEQANIITEKLTEHHAAQKKNYGLLHFYVMTLRIHSAMQSLLKLQQFTLFLPFNRDKSPIFHFVLANNPIETILLLPY